MTKRVWGLCGGLLAGLVARGAEAPALAVDFDGQDVAAAPGSCAAVGVPGVRGGALWFWGAEGQGVTVPGSAGLALEDAVTVSAWIWAQGFGDHQTIVWKGTREPVVDQVTFRLAVRPEGRLEFSFKGPAGEWYTLVSPEAVPLGRWAHVSGGFSRGQAALDIDGKRVAAGRVGGHGVSATAWQGDRLLPNAAPVEIGAGQEPSGEPGQFFRGAVDEVRVWARMFAEPPQPEPPATTASPIEATLLFDETFTAGQIAEKPWLAGRVADPAVPWMLVAEYPGMARQGLRTAGAHAADGTFRYLLDDYCGLIDLRGAERVRLRGYACGGRMPAARAAAGLEADGGRARVTVHADRPLQTMRGFGCYADFPKTFLADAGARERAYAPLLDALRDAGVTRLDFSFGTGMLEPQNDDDDPGHINWAPLRKRFAEEASLRTLAGYLKYVRSKGFEIGLRAISFAGWQWAGSGAARVPKSDEVAESCVALLMLLREEGIEPTHLVPVWEPSYPPEAVAEVCAATARLARRHGLALPVVGPYRITTGGQGMDTDTMPDRYLNGQRYVGAYLKAMGDLATVVGVEDYASGWAMAEPNLQRLVREVIAPFGPVAGRERELWMLEYGPLCGIGPWNFYPSRWHGAYAGYESAFRLAKMVHQGLNGGVHAFYFWKAYDAVGDAETISSFGLIKGVRHDSERRPPYHTARVLWRHVPPGARHVACTAEAGLMANAFESEGSVTVLLTNPRGCAVEAEVRLPPGAYAPVATLYSAEEAVTYQEREVCLGGGNVARVRLPPRSVHALACRAAWVATPFGRTVWVSGDAADAYLSDLAWEAVSVRGSAGLMREPINGMNVSVFRDETPSGDWLTLGGSRYRKGLGMRATGEVTYALDGAWQVFEAEVGIDDAARKDGAVVFRVFADGREVFASGEMKAGEPARRVNVALGGVKALRLTVTGGNGTFADWADARLRREGAK